MINTRKLNRRQFIVSSSLGVSALGLDLKGHARRLFAAETQNSGAGPNETIRIGMIAAGARAHQLMEIIMQIPGTEIAAVCDAYSGRVERAIERTGGRAKAYPDYREILNDGSIDAVVISTPDHLHVKEAVEAVQAGKHIYIEKPMTYSVDEGLEIISACRKNKVAFQVGSSGCSSVLAEKAREMIAEGRLGQVTMIRASYNRNTASGAWIYPIPPDASAETINWDMFLGPAPRVPFSPERFFRWRCYRDYSGGISTDLFVHLCNTIHYIMDTDMCESAVAMGALYRWKESRNVPDTINASLRYPEGFMLNISSTFNNSNAPGGGIQFLGTEGTLDLNGGSLSFIPENVHENNSWITDSWPADLQEAYYNDPGIRREEMPWTRDPSLVNGSETYTAEGLDATTIHMMEFFEAIRTGAATREDAVPGHYAASCAHMVNRSIETNTSVFWDQSRMRLK